MKNLLKCALVLAVLTAPCLAQKKERDDGLESTLVASEKRVIWEAVTKKEMKVLEDSLMDDYLDVSDVGVFTKQETLKLIPDLEVRDYTLSEFRVLMLDRDAAVVTYKAVQHWSINGQPGPTDVRASSVWVKRGGKWRVAFHQESALQ